VLTSGKLGCGLFENIAEVEKIASEFNAVNTILPLRPNVHWGETSPAVKTGEESTK